MADKSFSQQETLTLLQEKAKEFSDSFRVKVFRKRNQLALPDLVASFEDASIDHIVSPELWLPKIAGGGPIFQMAIYPPIGTDQIGGFISFMSTGDEVPVDTELVRDPSWRGPKRIIYPDPSRHAGATALPTLSYAVTPPPGARAPIPAPRNAQGQENGHSGGGLSEAEYVLRRREQELEESRRKLEREEQERRHKFDMEQAEARHRMELEALRTEIRAAAQTQQAAPKTDLFATLAPLVAGFIQESRQSAQKAQDAMVQLQTKMLEMSAQRPAIDPAVKEILAALQANKQPDLSEQSHRMMMTMTESMGAMMKVTMSAVDKAANYGGGDPPPNPMVQVVKEGVRAVSALMDGYKAQVAARGPVPQLPAQIPQPPQPTPYAQAAAAPVPQPAQPAAAVPAPQPPPPPPQPRVNQLDRLVMMIRNKTNPPDVADVFIQATQTSPEVQQGLAAVEGSIEEFGARIVGPWAMESPDNANYLAAVLKQIYEKGTAAGLLEPAEPEEAEEAADDDD
jgi:hypothetical protein